MNGHSTFSAHSEDKTVPLLPDAIDIAAREKPDATWAEYTASTRSYDEGYRRVTYGQLALAVSHATSFLLSTYGPGTDFETLAYCGPNDLRYPIFIVAALKAGYKLLLPSPRNSPDAHRNLLEKSSCTKLLAPQPVAGSLQQVADELGIKARGPPSLESLLTPGAEKGGNDANGSDDGSMRPFKGAPSDPAVVLQTSGTTGLPKPIVIPLSFAVVWSRMTAFQPKSGRNQPSYLHGNRVFCTLPMFHAVGVYFGLFSTVYRSTVVVQAPSHTIPTATSLCEALDATKIEAVFVSPALVEELSKESQLLEKVANSVRTIVYTGGDLPQWSGDIVSSKMHLFTIYGTTEIGHGPQTILEGRGKEDWGYLSWDEEIWGARFRDHGEGLYELYFDSNETSLQYQAGFTIFAGEESFGTKDLFSKHPTLPNLWKYRGRSDDTLVFVTGEKVNPLLYEGELSRHPDIRAALMIGNQRFQAALLIEAKDPPESSRQEEVLDAIWPAIEAANQSLPNYAHVLKSHVILTTPERPLIRAGKGTVVRRLSLELYSDQIDQLYSRSDSGLLSQADPIHMSLPDLRDLISVRGYVKECILQITNWSGLRDSEDFFARGLNSLQVLQLRTRLHALQQSIGIKSIYQNPTLDLLSSALHSSSQESSSNGTNLSTQEAQRTFLNKRLQEYKMLMDNSKPADSPSDERNDRSAKSNVVLTGSTGTVGVYLLKSLLDTDYIGHVYCLCRGADGKERQMQAIARQQLPCELVADRVSFIETDLGDKHLGLTAERFNELASAADSIIHNAWNVNFMQSLQSFESSIVGLINLLGLARSAHSGCNFVFVSSISAVQRYSESQVVPETSFEDPLVSSDSGYGQSKWLAERLVEHAAAEHGIHGAIARIGQITGPSTLSGDWTSREWFPSLVITSANLGLLPLSLPFSDHGSNGSLMPWVPVDSVAEIVANYAVQSRQNAGGEIVHVANPHDSSWSASLPVLLDQLNKGGQSLGPQGKRTVKTVSYAQWLEAVRRLSKDRTAEKDAENLLVSFPALKLLNFFEDGAHSVSAPQLGLQKSSVELPELDHVHAVDGKFLAGWAQRWIEGF